MYTIQKPDKQSMNHAAGDVPYVSLKKRIAGVGGRHHS